MINLMFCGNKKVFDGLIIAMLSILKHTKEPLHLFILTADLHEINEDFVPLGEEERIKLASILKDANEKNEITLVDITDNYKREMLVGANMDTNYTPYIFLRLFADEIKEIPDKVLYLDADIVVYDDLKDAIKELQENGVTIYAAHLNGEAYYNEKTYEGSTGILIGNESKGLSDEISEMADFLIKIPMEGKLESLNAAVSAAILMYEIRKKR